MTLRSFYRLEGGVRHYAWGERASQDFQPMIARMLGQDPGEEPWAELWLGAHPSLPGTVTLQDANGKEERVALDQAIARNPQEWLGSAAHAAGGQLPFLLKVLTCSAPLSIQSHPDAESAVVLHQEHPELYPDAHDKTEILIALEPFRALAGFRGMSDILQDLEAVEAFQPWLALWRYGKQTLRGLVESLFSLNVVPLAAMLTQALLEIRQRPQESLRESDRLFLSLSQEYPGDRGTLFAYLLNQVNLAPGEAVFLAPNSPHAYQKGAGVECMTNSDNVIRAGLTPKAVDVPTLLKTVDFDRTGYRLVTPVATPGADGKGEKLDYQAPTKKFHLTFYQDAPCTLGEHPEALGILLVVKGAATLEAPGQSAIQAATGTSWIRPACASQGTATPAEPGTLMVWAQSDF